MNLSLIQLGFISAINRRYIGLIWPVLTQGAGCLGLMFRKSCCECSFSAEAALLEPMYQQKASAHSLSQSVSG